MIIIDEVDQIRDDDVLYELLRFHEAGLSFIANDQKAFSHFEERVCSRLSWVKKIRLKRYKSEELTDISNMRRKHGLRGGSILNFQLHKIASKAGGDSRVALNSLRFAAREAENKGLENITGEIIQEAVSDAYDEERLDPLERLNRHQKAVYKVLKEEDRLKIGELYEEYRTKVDGAKSKRTLRRYFNKMEAYDVVEADGEKSGKPILKG